MVCCGVRGFPLHLHFVQGLRFVINESWSILYRVTGYRKTISSYSVISFDGVPLGVVTIHKLIDSPRTPRNIEEGPTASVGSI